jgi:hypothetical protein
MRLEDLAREHHAMTIAAGIAVAMGGEVDPPEWEDMKADFDERLAATPAGRSGSDRSARGIKLRALGMG